MPESSRKANQTEKRLQIFFGIAVALVVIGLLFFFVLAAKDLVR